MSVEYGCATTNKFCFLDENEVEDPSDLLAQVSISATKTAKDAKAPATASKGKVAAGKPGDKTATSSASSTSKVGSATGKPKQPLQQSDNSVKSGNFFCQINSFFFSQFF